MLPLKFKPMGNSVVSRLGRRAVAILAPITITVRAGNARHNDARDSQTILGRPAHATRMRLISRSSLWLQPGGAPPKLIWPIMALTIGSDNILLSVASR